jgi:hypothetical protein
MTRALRPLIREIKFAYYRWALHELQQKDPHHADIPLIVLRLRDLRAERVSSDSIYSSFVRWL